MRALAAVAMLVAVLGSTAPAAATPGPSDAPEYWFDAWQVPSLWHAGVRGQGITIAEIDTGVNANLPELRGRVVTGVDLGKAGNGQIDRQLDAFGHGTAMASIMVARPGVLGITGLAPAARVMPIAVPLGGTTTEEQPDQVPQAIRYAADHGAQIISMSLGGDRSPAVDTEPCPADEQAAIFAALRKGSLVIASVGNTGPTKNTIEDPGVCLGVISVGAVDGTGQVASFSGREPYLTLVAPGVNVPSLGRIAGQAFAGEGTSQAAAITAAVAALVWSAHPHLDAAGVAARLVNTLDNPQDPPSPDYGYGVLNAHRAVTADVPADAPNPVYDAVRPFLERAAAHSRPPPVAPSAAGGQPMPGGAYAVGARPWLTTQVAMGIGLAAAGLLLAGGSGWAGWRAGGPAGAYRPSPGPSRRHPRPYTRPRPGAPRTRPLPRPRRRPVPSRVLLG
jgi:subtilisin family serine protease